VVVGLGGFSKFLVDELRPRSFHAFDIFLLHNEKQLYGQSAIDILGQSHVEFYRSAIQSTRAEIVLHEGPSQQTLAKIQDHCF
jgi:hypothetical protein